ncbi:hypothetical protein BLX24_14180 [Arsenicibacter rosenii]|uniref:Putative restriction endonuclease domain-containing protein n=2 Tax=Arsenicibacter rosenii TaxID=1750698 RepID=A0A1S2VIX3_9BACT|nr:hypothetical protein BLX24_14180 [Arsenicibacter rosenii]
MVAETKRWLFTVDAYHRMAETGILSENDRVELIKGELINMSPIGVRHAACVNKLTYLLGQFIGQKAIISVQNPIRLNRYSEPEPDIMLLRPRSDFYANAHPTANDVLLLIEVSETTLTYDRTTKLPLYAQADIPEVWIVNLAENQLEVYQTPTEATYQHRRFLSLTETVSIAQLSIPELAVRDIIP